MSNNPILWAGMAIIATALLALVFFGNQPTVAGLSPDQFAGAAQLLAVGLLVGAGVLSRAQLGQYRLWHVAAWLAGLVVLMAGYNWYHS